MTARALAWGGWGVLPVPLPTDSRLSLPWCSPGACAVVEAWSWSCSGRSRAEAPPRYSVSWSRSPAAGAAWVLLTPEVPAPPLVPGAEESCPSPALPPLPCHTAPEGTGGSQAPGIGQPSWFPHLHVHPGPPPCSAVLPAAPQGFAANLAPAPGSGRRCHGAVGKSGSVCSFNICKVCLPGLTGPDSAARAGCRGPTVPRHHGTLSPGWPGQPRHRPCGRCSPKPVPSRRPTSQQAAGCTRTIQTRLTFGSSCRVAPLPVVGPCPPPPPSISHDRETEALLTNVNGSRNHAGSGAEGSQGARRRPPRPHVHSVHNTVRVFLK